MKNVKTESLEELLEAAGFQFEVVDRCPHPRCEVCRPTEVSKAA